MLYLIGFFLLFIFLLLVIVYFVFKKSKPASFDASPQAETKTISLHQLVAILKSEKQDKTVLEGMVDKVVKNFPFPDNEKEANEHFEFVYFYAKNPLSTAKMIVEMQKKLAQANPKYAKQIEDFQMRGVEARKK